MESSTENALFTKKRNLQVLSLVNIVPKRHSNLLPAFLKDAKEKVRMILFSVNKVQYSNSSKVVLFEFIGQVCIVFWIPQKRA